MPAPAPTPVGPGPAANVQSTEITPTAPNARPVFFSPPQTQVGIGQTVHFAITAIDPDGDEVASEVVSMPPSATLDPITVTVKFTPTKADGPRANFTIRLTELRLDGSKAEYLETFGLDVVAKTVAPPVPRRERAVVENLLTIRQPAVLKAVERQWPFAKMLTRAAQLKLGTALKAASPQRAFESFLASLARAHQNPRVDPDNAAFDRDAFGDPNSWHLIAVRPRVDKAFMELRLVYQATRAPEPVFAMFRLRVVPGTPDLPPEAKPYGNQVFSKLVLDHFFNKDGEFATDAYDSTAAHAKAVSAFVTKVIEFTDEKVPYGRGSFLALATEARLGGGSRRNPDGTYAAGDGWGWAVQQPSVATDGDIAYANVPIPGFWTSVVPSDDGKQWVGKCAKRFHPDSPGHAPGYEALCRVASGFVDLPAIADGKVVSSTVDATNLFREHKQIHAIAELPLRDPRRDHGEENGMTCSECHVRNFAVRNYGDAGGASPAGGMPTTLNAPLALTNFVIVPTDAWSEFTLNFMKDQECKAKEALATFGGRTTKLACLLSPAAE